MLNFPDNGKPQVYKFTILLGYISMFKLTVEQILASISSLSAEEREDLKQKLPEVMSVVHSSPASGQNMVNNLGNVMFGTGNNAFNFQPAIAGDDINTSTKLTQSSPECRDLVEALETLKHAIRNSEQLSKLVKTGAEAEVDNLVNEAQKAEPDKNLITHTITALKQGLQGVQELAPSVATVASIVAKAWGIPIL